MLRYKLVFICMLSIANYLLAYKLGDPENSNNGIDGTQNVDNRSLFYYLPDEVKFYLYTRSNPTNGSLLNSTETIKSSYYDASKSTKFVTHGFRSSGFSDTCQEIKDYYLKHMDVNVIIMDWERIAGNIFYLIPAVMTLDVGKYYAKFIDQLNEYGADPATIHLVGHSLGAHISGFAGQFSKNKIGRITGLDPAFPSFGLIQLVGLRLNSNQANFVDIIHTSAGTLGLREAIGHIDFYPNGGTLPQPGCGGVEEVIQSCSHGRSWQYFKESIDPNMRFMSFKSRSYEEYLAKKYIGNYELLGEYVSRNASGIYYVQTKPDSPFSKNNE